MKSKPILRKIFHNPFFIALVLTVLAMIIIFAIYRVQNYGAANVFKCGFYMFLCFSIILFINSILVKKIITQSQVKTEVKEVFSGIDMSKEMSHDIIQIKPNLYTDTDYDIVDVTKSETIRDNTKIEQIQSVDSDDDEEIIIGGGGNTNGGSGNTNGGSGNTNSGDTNSGGGNTNSGSGNTNSGSSDTNNGGNDTNNGGSDTKKNDETNVNYILDSIVKVAAI
jgi:uncharacterized membrane protein YgcG